MLLWTVIISGLSVLLIAAQSRKSVQVCSAVFIGIRSSAGKFYVEKDDILKLAEATAGGSLEGQPVAGIDLTSLEKSLEANSWIRDAELYFDSKDALHIAVEERQPIARIFTVHGNSFYIDSSGHFMTLVDKMSARVPVITGFVEGKGSRRDSLFMEEVKAVANFIYNDTFWNAQTGQIDITPQRKFELVPVLGDHIIRIGNGKDLESKFRRLYVFYKQALPKLGLNKYATLDVQYSGQVLGIRKEAASPVDSLQLQKNIEMLVSKASLLELDDQMLPQTQQPIINDSTVSITPGVSNQVSTKTNPIPIETRQSGNPAAAQPSKPTESPQQKNVRSNNVKQPKAVMKRN